MTGTVLGKPATYYYPANDTWTIRLDEADRKGGWKRFADCLAMRR